MNLSLRSYTPAQASASLGVSAKALRLYEQHGLLSPDRTRTGWRTYDAAVMARAAEIVALRNLGLSLVQVARVLSGEPRDLDAALAAHEARLSEAGQRTAAALERIRSLRAELAQGRVPTAATLAQAIAENAPATVGFALPWPWAGEWFAIHDVPRLSFITGALGSGKTRFAQTLAAALPDADFLALDRLRDPAIAQRLAEDPLLAERVERRLTWLVEDGAERSEALTTLVVALEAAKPTALVVDMVEEGLNAATQVALMAHLRLRGMSKRMLVLMTRSSAILDLDMLEPSEIVILCPANHSVPLLTAPYPGGQGYEAVATCIASPEVRARTAGVVAMRLHDLSGRTASTSSQSC
ncbi:MerR family transcriptional regulator [Mesorhizobium sp. RP14(2022)]|uniref:MerR family transcriptional regulator n=1 Tax=Mesorhizobium liriopis TaxID=2953882 RepID=A0ABT1CA78_9HYPH|nr:MerR family transcriptional regulator [Mesorhizobium liriopis]MCO6051738.1 MerR family transcriptional regulator [Mesorhizobium liriopis]